MENLPNTGLTGFVFVQNLDSDMILCKGACDLSVANIPKLVKSTYNTTVYSLYLKDTSDLEEYYGSYNEVAFYRNFRNHEADLKNKKNMSRRVIPDFYIGNPSDPEVAKILKEYNIPVLDVNRNKYPIKEKINEKENKNSGIEI